MHSAAGLAAAAAAIQSSSGISSDSQHPANSMTSEQNTKPRMGHLEISRQMKKRLI